MLQSLEEFCYLRSKVDNRPTHSLKSGFDTCLDKAATKIGKRLSRVL